MPSLPLQLASRRFILSCLTMAWAVTLLFSMIPQADCAVRRWQDPVITHTNGMRLASSTSLRSHNAYWQCDPDRVGYCDGRMHGPCRNDLRSLGTRRCGYPLPVGPAPGMTGTQTGHSMEGLETGDAERLGTLRMDEGDALRMSIAPPTPAPSPMGGGNIMDALKTLGVGAGI